MEQNSQLHRDGIESQVKDAFCRVVYTYTTHLKCANLLRRQSQKLKWALIILSAISVCGLLGVILDWNTRLLAIATAVVTTLDLVLSTYAKSANLDDQIISHRETANQLWLIREQYVAFLSDLPTMELSQAVKTRDKLTERVSHIYSKAPFTTTKAYRLAQQALKREEEQYFSEDERNLLLPPHLRK